jgi:alkanesulfonate monooxygenase SsuD/methylene tetrahydromethanopterin reductase-like flavin-dependent oxidoreductase (luciferase family)
MKHWQGVAVAVVCWAVAGAAQAFTIMAKSEDPLLSEDALRNAVTQAAASVGNNIPDNPNVKVFVSSKARLTKENDGSYVYLHRVELRRAFSAGPPYATAEYLPIESREYYGVGTPDEVHAKLDETLREFFTTLKSIDPGRGFK